jgi:uncharacterized protein YpbB
VAQNSTKWAKTGQNTTQTRPKHELEDLLNKMLSKKACAVVAAMHASASLAQSEWQTAVRAARRTWDKWLAMGELRQQTWELIIGFRDKWYPQLPSTYRDLCDTAMFCDLNWMHSSPVPQDVEDMIRRLAVPQS